MFNYSQYIPSRNFLSTISLLYPNHFNPAFLMKNHVGLIKIREIREELFRNYRFLTRFIWQIIGLVIIIAAIAHQ